MNNNKKITLVIGTGGIKCAAAIGMWRVLQAENIEGDSVVGCSGGSLNGACIAQVLTGAIWRLYPEACERVKSCKAIHSKLKRF